MSDSERRAVFAPPYSGSNAAAVARVVASSAIDRCDSVCLLGLQPIVVMATIPTVSLWFACFGILALRARL